MLKEVTRNATIDALLAKAFGDENLRPDTVAIFETVLANGNPIRKRGIYREARLQDDSLAEMNDWMKSGRHVPLILMHESGTLPVGKVFSTELRQTSGGLNLHGLFYIPRETGAELISKINTGVIAEVSVGIQNRKMLCSECGWDYLSAEATVDNVWDCTCANGHKVGENGTHTRLFGISDWMEVSLVDRGAVPGAAILNRSRQTFSMDADQKVSLRLYASANLPAREDKPNMELQQQLIETKVSLGLVEKERDALKTSVDAANTEIAALKAKITELEGKVATNVDDLKAQVAAADEFVEQTAKAVLLATGKTVENVPSKMDERIKLIRESGIALAASIKPGGVSNPAQGGEKKSEASRSYAAFTGRTEG